MKTHKERLKKFLSFWCLMYPAAIAIGLAVIVFRRLVGWVQIRGLENLPRDERPVVLVSNHSSLWEPILLIGLFFPRYLLRPTCIPWSVPDKHNYYDHPFWGMYKSRFIPVTRNDCQKRWRAFRGMIKVLRSGGSVILFPEGGRTAKGKKFLLSRSGKRLRELDRGVGHVICGVDCTVVPVWVDGAEKVLPIGKWFPRVHHGMTITIGKPFRERPISTRRKSDIDERMDRVSNALLETAG